MPSSDDLHFQIREAADYIRQYWDAVPRVGIILGTGLGEFAGELEVAAALDYARIPHFVESTAIGHRGTLACGMLGGVPTVAMEGRVHRYEGYPLSLVTLPVRVMKELGVQLLVVSNASGGLNPHFSSGDVMVLEDHINLLNANPLVGSHDLRLGPRFPDMSCPYDPALIDLAQQVARQHGVSCPRGVYAAMAGPNYETRAEYRFLRRIGADVVGMSTVPEVLVAVQTGLRVLALSAVTNLCRPDILQATSAEAVIEAARLAEPKMRRIVRGVVEHWFAASPMC